MKRCLHQLQGNLDRVNLRCFDLTPLVRLTLTVCRSQEQKWENSLLTQRKFAFDCSSRSVTFAGHCLLSSGWVKVHSAKLGVLIGWGLAYPWFLRCLGLWFCDSLCSGSLICCLCFLLASALQVELIPAPSSWPTQRLQLPRPSRNLAALDSADPVPLRLISVTGHRQADEKNGEGKGRTSASRWKAIRIGVPMKNCNRVNRIRCKQTVPMTQPFGTRPAKEEQSLTCFHVGSCLQWHIRNAYQSYMSSGHGLNS